MKSAGPKQEWHSILEVCAGESKLWCCKEQYCIGIWNVTSMNQGTLDMVKQEIVRLNSDILEISSVQSLSCVRLFATPWTAAHQVSLSITDSWSLLKLMFIESVMPSNHLILCHPRLLLPSIFPSIRIFSNESVLHIRWLKHWRFSFNISPANEHPGLIFRMDWLDLLAVQGTLKSLLQPYSSKASILQRSAFFIPSWLLEKLVLTR